MLHGSAGWRRELSGVGRRPFPDAWISAVPFKAKAACRRHIAKQRHRVTNWAEYDAGLRARGSLTVWFTPASVLTDKDADDGSQVGPLLDQVDGPVASFTGDG